MNLIQDVLRAAESKPEQDRFVRVKLEDILPDPENFYNTDEIEELVAAIDAFGLEQPLVVRPAVDEPGKYRLTGGHRRRLAPAHPVRQRPRPLAGSRCTADNQPRCPLQIRRGLF